MVRRSNIFITSLKYILLSAGLVIMVAPLLWMFRVSFMDIGQSISLANLLDSSFTFSNFTDLFVDIEIGTVMGSNLSLEPAPETEHHTGHDGSHH